MTDRPTSRLWGPETEKALANFPISDERMPATVVHWLGRIKQVAAVVNAELGLLDPALAERIADAAARVARGELDDQFPLDVFQTGSGTSTHMNVNEVIANVAGTGVHPNDHVNMCQSSNCVFPTAVHLAAVEGVVGRLMPALGRLAATLDDRSVAFMDIVKAGRTHLMDAVPVTLGQEFAGYAAQVRQSSSRIDATVERLAQVPLGGTATGTGLNVHPEFAERARARLREETGLPVNPPAHPFEATGARDGLVEASGALRTTAVSLMKVANDLRWLGSGPRTGLGEIVLPELQKGSTMMPGKVNPVIPEVVTQVAAQVVGNDAAIAMAGSHGHLELNAFVPVMARNLIQSIDLLARVTPVFADRCVAGIDADEARCREGAEMTLSTATALTPVLGYDLVGAIVREAALSRRPLRDVAVERGVATELLDALLDYRAMALGGIVPAPRTARRP